MQYESPFRKRRYFRRLSQQQYPGENSNQLGLSASTAAEIGLRRGAKAISRRSYFRSYGKQKPLPPKPKIWPPQNYQNIDISSPDSGIFSNRYHEEPINPEPVTGRWNRNGNTVVLVDCRGSDKRTKDK